MKSKNYNNDLANVSGIRTRYFSYSSFYSVSANSYRTLTIDVSSIALSGYNLVAIPNGFTSDSSGDTMCVMVSVSISGTSLSMCIRNYSTNTSASLKPIVQVLRVKAL